MELDLDAFLQSQNITDDDDDDHGILNSYPRRTVDEILNDSDSSSSSSSSPPPRQRSSSDHFAFDTKPDSPPPGRNLHRDNGDSVSSPKTLRDSSDSEALSSSEPQSNSSSIGRMRSGDFSGNSFLLPRNSLPPLFGGVRHNVKPGAALAAAAAASRSIRTPHAAAIKSRRASGVTLQKVPDPGELVARHGDPEVVSNAGSDFGELGAPSAVSVSDLSDTFVEEGDVMCDFVPASIESAPEVDVRIRQSADEGGGVLRSDEILAEVGQVYPSSHESLMTSVIDNKVKFEDDSFTVSDPVEIKNDQLPSPSDDDINDVDSSCVSSFDGGRQMVEDLTIASTEEEDGKVVTGHSNDMEVNLVGDDMILEGGGTDFSMESMLEHGGERSITETGKSLCSSLKPLELAEELEKKHAFTGLHWEEGAAAQPMKLEGVRRESTTLGYFDIDSNNTITRTISSQAFKRDHGSPLVVAVHLNFIAVGTSKGLIVVVPSNYSPHCADKMDTKMLMLGLQGDRSEVAVTSMCFSQQGDLLFAGYGDGRITVWDVQKGNAVKVMTETHKAPVVHMLYLGQDSQVTRQFRVVSGDSKGLLWLITFKVVLWLNRYSFTTTCLLDGKTTGKVLCASPLLSDECCGGALMSSQGNPAGTTSAIGAMMGGVVGGDTGWKLFAEGSSLVEEGVVIFVTHQTALVARVSPKVEVYAQFSKPDGAREGSMPYTAWKCMAQTQSSSTGNMPLETSEKVSLLAIAWDRKVQVAKLVKSELKVYGKWTLESSAIGVAWLDDQILVILTVTGQLSLYAKDGTVIHQTSFSVNGSGGDDLITYHTHFTNVFGNPEKAYHNSVAVRGASIYIIGPKQLVISRLLPWKERIQVLRKAGDWMGALNMAMTLYDGQAHGIIDLPGALETVQETLMPHLEELLLSYVDEVFSYISVAFCSQIGKLEQFDGSESKSRSVHIEIKEQFTRVGGVAVEFCVHIKRTDILFNAILSKFVAVQHRDTFLELLEPYILKDMLGSLPPEIMQALVEHYSTKGWLQRIEQCVLHMDISSLDFNQVVRLCREHRLYGALIYLFNEGLDDFRAPLEELLTVLRSSQKESAVALGYRMLVYLKYCFSGLAFPPGRGSLPATRLPSLRMELVQFLLEDSEAPTLCPVKSLLCEGEYCNLYHLLELDTKATLEVLTCAFVEDEIPKSDHSLCDSANAHVEAKKEIDPMAKRQNLLVHQTVNALVHILEKFNSKTGTSTSSDDNGLEDWPSKIDIGHILEFTAHYVSCKKATVSNRILNQIFEYFTSEVSLPQSNSRPNSEALKRRGKQVLAILEVVPETNWEVSYVLHLCEKVQFYQVCGLIHAMRHQYVPALDSYMKDVEEPIHAFSFIIETMERLSNTDFDAFRSAVISRIPDLINLSREDAFFLIIDRFSTEVQYILSELRSHPKSLFLYLKTVVEFHLSGTLNFSCLTRDSTELSSGRARHLVDRVEAYMERISDFPKFLRDNPLNVSDDMIELYLELLCKYERNSVLKFLETFESYRVEHCLRLCQEYGIIDASAFLLERVGDVGSALSLTLSRLADEFVILDTAVVSDAGREHSSAVLKVNEINDILHACIGMCQRNTPRLDPEEAESLWFQLLDLVCKPLMNSSTDTMVTGGENQVGMVAEYMGQDHEKPQTMEWKISKSHKGARTLRRFFSQFIKVIVQGMIGYVHLPTIMSKLLSDNGSQEFGDFKDTILGMLGTYGFERRILDTAKSVIEDDTFYTMSLLKKGASHGYAPQSLQCCICNCLLLSKINSTTSGIRIFNCGHATHIHCEEFQEPEESLRGGGSHSLGCPICMPVKKKSQRTRNKTVGHAENGLVSKPPLQRPRQTQASIALHPHETDAYESSRGILQIPRFEILSNLQKDHRVIQIENVPQLRLAPPSVYHEKVQKGIDLLAGERGSVVTMEKPSKNRKFKDLKAKGSSSTRFPLKSPIFGKGKKIALK